MNLRRSGVILINLKDLERFWMNLKEVWSDSG